MVKNRLQTLSIELLSEYWEYYFDHMAEIETFNEIEEKINEYYDQRS